MRSSLLARFAVALPLLSVSAGCAMAQTPTQDVRIRPLVASRSDVVVAAEIRSVETGQNALEALRRLRPEFLKRGPTVPEDPEAGFPAVYVDGIRLGGPETLRDIPTGSIKEIRFLKPGVAYEKYGRHHRGGVIAVSTGR